MKVNYKRVTLIEGMFEAMVNGGYYPRVREVHYDERLNLGFQCVPIIGGGVATIPCIGGWQPCRTFAELRSSATMLSSLEWGSRHITTIDQMLYCMANRGGLRHLCPYEYKGIEYYMAPGVVMHGDKVLLCTTVDLYESRQRVRDNVRQFLRWNNPVIHLHPEVFSNGTYKWLKQIVTDLIFPCQYVIPYRVARTPVDRPIDAPTGFTVSYKIGDTQRFITKIQSPALDENVGIVINQGIQTELENIQRIFV